MAAPSGVYALGFPEPERTNAKELSTANDVGQYFKEVLGRSELKLSQKELEREEGASAEALKGFLDFIGVTTRGTFKQFLREAKGLNINAYDNLRHRYERNGFKGFTRGLYFIDEELLVKRKGIFANPNRPESAKEKIKIIVHAMLWIDKLDSSPGKSGWKLTFTSFSRDRLEEDLRWFQSPRMHRFLRSGDETQLDGEEQQLLDQLWEWFDTHDQRAIKLVFSMARHEIFCPEPWRTATFDPIIDALVVVNRCVE